jgi:hypothetical protein
VHEHWHENAAARAVVQPAQHKRSAEQADQERRHGRPGEFASLGMGALSLSNLRGASHAKASA